MRKDMSKVMSECYRFGRSLIVKKGRIPRDFEDLPVRQGMTSTYQGLWGARMKERRLNHKPLQRFLEKQVGREWDKVHHEICESIDCTIAANYPIFEQLKREVLLHNLVVHEGQVFEQYSKHIKFSPSRLYVHPESGILCRPTGPKSKKKVHPVTEKQLSPLLKLLKIGDSWFQVQFTLLTETPAAHSNLPRYIRDALTGATHPSSGRFYKDAPLAIAITKKQLGKKDLLKYRLF